MKTRPEVGESVEIRNASGCLFFFVLLVVLFIVRQIINKVNNLISFFVLAGTFIVVVLLSNWFSRIPGRRKILLINRDFIWIYKVGTGVKWEFVLRTDIKTVSDYDSTDHFFIIHYYDEKYQYFRSLEMDTAKMNISPEKLSFYIEHFKNGSQ